MAEHHLVYMDDIDSVCPQFGALLLIVIGAHRGDQNAADLILARPIDSEQPLTHRLDRGDVRVIGMVVANSHDMRGWAADIHPNRAIERIGQHDAVAPPQAKGGMSEILYIRHDSS